MHLSTLRYRKYNPDGVRDTVRLVWTIECTMDNGTPQCLVEMGRGGACVPAHVALQGRIHRSILVHNAYIFGMETPLRGRSGGHTGTAPTIPNTHRRSAKMKTKILMLAVTLQALKCKNIVPALRGDDKT